MQQQKLHNVRGKMSLIYLRAYHDNHLPKAQLSDKQRLEAFLSEQQIVFEQPSFWSLHHHAVNVERNVPDQGTI